MYTIESISQSSAEIFFNQRLSLSTDTLERPYMHPRYIQTMLKCT